MQTSADLHTQNPITALPGAEPEYVAEVEAERRERAQTLLQDVGFLTLAGLDWLKPGRNTLGAHPDNDLVLPAGRAPDFAATLVWTEAASGSIITLISAPDVTITDPHGQRVLQQTIKTDGDGAPDYLYMGDLIFLVLERGERRAFRLYDKEFAGRKNFRGLHWYPISPAFRIMADYIPHNPPKTLPIADATGRHFQVESPGYVQFKWQGSVYRLDAQDRGQRLFYNFADATNGDTTYGAGRFLYSPLPHAGQVVLDFNRATNPYCAYSPYATCPLPPPDNRLDYRVEAGEKNYQAQT